MSFVSWFLLLVVVAGVGAFVAMQRQRSLPPPPPRPLGDPNDLTSLGLSPARPRPVGAHPDDDDPYIQSHTPVVPLPAVPTSPAEDGPRPVARAIGPPRVATARNTRWADPAVSHLLASLAAHVGGPVAVVRHDGRHHVVEARTDGGALTPVEGSPLALDGPADLGPGVLGGLSSLVSGFALAVPAGPSVVLVGGDTDDDRMVDYLRLLASLVPDLEIGAASAPSAPAAEAADTMPEAGALADVPSSRQPRADIIAEEQRAAVAAGRPLAFALVTLADAEERFAANDEAALAQAEADLRARLGAAPDVRRIEPFGDLLFGVFLTLDREGTARWCDRLASGAPPLFIGAVAPADGDPTGIRNAAADALRDAYDQQRSRVVEP